jgi:PIN domain nuclease of toxin-antitoxin system
MLTAVADTHAILWYIYNDPRLSMRALTFVDGEIVGGHQIGLSSITLAEIVYLGEKGRIPSGAFADVTTLLIQPNAALVEVPFDMAIARPMLLVRRSDVPDMPDRIIAATALHLGVPLISRDGRIRLSSVRTIW